MRRTYVTHDTDNWKVIVHYKESGDETICTTFNFNFCYNKNGNDRHFFISISRETWLTNDPYNDDKSSYVHFSPAIFSKKSADEMRKRFAKFKEELNDDVTVEDIKGLWKGLERIHNE